MVMQRIEADQNQQSLHLVVLGTYETSLARYALLPAVCDNCVYFLTPAPPQQAGSRGQHARLVYVTYVSCTYDKAKMSK